MWILPKQLHTSAYAPDTKALDLDSEAFSQICEKSLSWRGKDSLSRTWLQRWKRENWMQHLCTRTLKPSHTESFEDAWTSSLVDFRANHSALLESVKLLKTQDTSSLTSQTELESANLELFSLKTYKESSVARQPTENQFSSMSSESWKDWVIEQRQEYSQRKKSAHLTREKESLSWATPVSMNDGIYADNSPNKKNRHSEGLATQAQNWSTPTVMDTANIQKPRKKNPSGGQKPPLCQEVKNWPTATARDWKGCGNAITRKDGKHRIDNLEAVIKYGHPDQANPNTNGKSQESWPTPNTSDRHGANLPHDLGRGYLRCEVLPKSIKETDCKTANRHGKLNPDWVEHLMGLPVGWTDLGSWETE